MKTLQNLGVRIDSFRVAEGQPLRLSGRPTSVRRLYKSKRQAESLLTARVEEISRLQGLLYAHHRYALLLIFQAMDAAGKDGAIKHVLSGVNPQGCRVHSFKQPSVEELDHDFLWRTVLRLPERGQIGIFNRSYYEEVLVVRVHPEWLARQNLPDEAGSAEALWNRRYQSIRDLERHLTVNGTRVVKFFLHVSEEEQRKRLLSRIDKPEKNWKANPGDIRERAFWEEYMAAYESCLSATSTAAAPWYTVPADDKKNARLIVAEIILQAMRSLPLKFPEVSAKQRQELQRVRAVLVEEGRKKKG